MSHRVPPWKSFCPSSRKISRHDRSGFDSPSGSGLSWFSLEQISSEGTAADAMGGSISRSSLRESEGHNSDNFSASWFRSTGLQKNSDAPRAMAASRAFGSAVAITIGIFLVFEDRLRRLMTSSPDPPGIPISSTMASGLLRNAIMLACTVSSADVTLKPFASSPLLRRANWKRESSAISIRGISTRILECTPVASL